MNTNTSNIQIQQADLSQLILEIPESWNYHVFPGLHAIFACISGITWTFSQLYPSKSEILVFPGLAATDPTSNIMGDITLQLISHHGMVS